MLTAILFTIFQTLLKNQIDPQKWLFGYFQACAQNGGRASEDLDAWLPWDLPAERKSSLALPGTSPMSDSGAITHRYCGRLFTADQMQQIRALIASEPKRNRAELSRLVCDQLGWLPPNRRRKEMSFRVAMLRMHRDGLICLPPPQKGNGNGRHRPRATAASDPPLLWRPSGDWDSLELRQVQSRPDSALWNELIQRYHYLKYKPLAGA